MERSGPCHGWVKYFSSSSALFIQSLCFVLHLCITPTGCLIYFRLEGWNKSKGLLVVCKPPFFFAVGVFDNCSHSLSEKGWSVGIRTVEPSSTKDARFYFSLRTDRAAKLTTVYSHQRYQANTWTHLMATYSGLHMTLYVDGAKVCVPSVPGGSLNRDSSCCCKFILWIDELAVAAL